MSYVLNVIYIPLACNEDAWFIKLTGRNAGSELYECDKEVEDYTVCRSQKKRGGSSIPPLFTISFVYITKESLYDYLQFI